MAARRALKAAGLPASYDVGVLAEAINHLLSEIQDEYGITVSEAVFTASHLIALYKDDLQDVAYHLKIRYVTPKHQFEPYICEAASAWAGHGLGLCEHWRDDERCIEESKQFPQIPVLAVHYSRNALTVALDMIRVAIGVFEPEYRHVENFTLGHDALGSYSSTQDYWVDVKATLLYIMTEFPLFKKPEKILVTGDTVNEEFLSFLQKTMEEHVGKVLPILSEDAMVVSAKGAAEFMRRGAAPWSD